MTKLKEVKRGRGRPPAKGGQAVPEQRILEMALQEFARYGYDGMTMSALAKDLGVSHNLLNVRFGSKEELWRRAIDAHVAAVGVPDATVFDAGGLDPETQLRELVAWFCRWTYDNPELVSITYHEGRHSSWRLDYIVDTYVLPFTRWIDDLLKKVSANRPVAPVSTFLLLAVIGQGVGFYLAAGPMLELIGGAHEISKKSRKQALQMFTDIVMNALLPPLASQSKSPKPAPKLAKKPAKKPAQKTAKKPAISRKK